MNVAASAEKKTAAGDDVAAALAGGEVPVAELLAVVPESALAAAWARGDVEFGKVKYVVTGNPETNVATHNGVTLPPASVVIEGGLEWTGPRQRWHGRLSDILRESLPHAPAYQKYQREVCVNKAKDVWEWLERPSDAKGRETRWARRDIDRAEAEQLFALYVRLTDKGMGNL